MYTNVTTYSSIPSNANHIESCFENMLKAVFVCFENEFEPEVSNYRNMDFREPGKNKNLDLRGGP